MLIHVFDIHRNTLQVWIVGVIRICKQIKNGFRKFKIKIIKTIKLNKYV